jgi:hypothetical protein
MAAAWVALALFFAPVVLTACGGGSSSAAGPAQIPGKAELTQCILAAGGHRWGQTPILPKGFPTGLTEVFMIGPEYAHLSYYIAKRPVFSQKTVRAFAEIQEYRAYVRFNGRVLVLLDPDIQQKDREIGFSCLVGGHES